MALIILLIGGCGTTNQKPEVGSQKPEVSKPEDRSTGEPANRINELIKQLGDDDWKVREKATEELIKIGKPAIEQVKEALGSKDPEVRQRANHIIDKIDLKLVEKYLKEINEQDEIRPVKYISPTQIKHGLIDKYLSCVLFYAAPSLPDREPPPIGMVLGVDIKTEKVFRVSEISDLKGYLKEVKDKEEAREISGVVTGLVGICPRCEGHGNVISKENFTAGEKDGCFYVEGEYKGRYSHPYKWVIKFDKDGKLGYMNQIQGEHRHQ
jgi:hypothetical protein